MDTPIEHGQQAAPDPDRVVAGYVIATQDEITIARTEAGDIVIEQREALGHEPASIVVRAGNVDQFLDYLGDLTRLFRWPVVPGQPP
jgi:hypothetical protein